MLLCFVFGCCLFRFVLVVDVLVWSVLVACLSCIFVVPRFGCLLLPLRVFVFVCLLVCLFCVVMFRVVLLFWFALLVCVVLF